MKRISATLFTLFFSFIAYGMERTHSTSPTPLASSPSNDGWLKSAERLLKRTTNNIVGHGSGYINELEGKQESFRADDMNLRDLLLLTHEGEWGLFDFLKDKDTEKLKYALELTEKHKVPLNPATISAAKYFLREGDPGPNFMRAFKGKKVGEIAIQDNNQTEYVHLAENAIMQFIEESNPIELNETLKAAQKHGLEINPHFKTRALNFLHIYQEQQKQKLLQALANIKMAEEFKHTIADIQLLNSTTPFKYNEFTKNTIAEMQLDRKN